MASPNPRTPSEDAKVIATMVREEDLEELGKLHRQMIDLVDQARGDGRLYIMGQYVRITAMLSSEMARVNRFFHRQTVAAMRKDFTGLKQAAKGAKDASTS